MKKLTVLILTILIILSVAVIGFVTTGNGTRTLEDKDNDEIYERVDYTGFNDYQGHVKAVYYKWDGQGFIESDEKMLYSYGEFSGRTTKYTVLISVAA